ncbi:MAG: hypothetical protein O2821_07110 [Chloroflexi bacterium]|nr:hypothetical protein [Chloroflexota bacterium]MDA1228818.1 hypothetical protein [Chloroflexota bacterium]
MKRTLFLAITGLLAIALACTGEVTTTADLTSSPALSRQPVTQEPLSAEGVPNSATSSPAITPTATLIPGPTPIPSSASFSIDVDSRPAPLVAEFSNTSQGQILAITVLKTALPLSSIHTKMWYSLNQTAITSAFILEGYSPIT